MKGSQKVQIKGSPGASISGVSYSVGGGVEGERSAADGPVVKVLFIAANPAATARLRLDKEIKAIEEAIRSSRHGPRFEVHQSWAATALDLQDGLLRFTPDLVHLSAHGELGGTIVLEEEEPRDLAAGGSRWPLEDGTGEGGRIAALARIFGAARGRLRCAVLNTCHSAATARAVAEHVGCVVGMSETIGDRAAIRFSWSFYNALGNGATVQAAFDLAAAQIRLGGLGSDELPCLFNGGVDPAKVLFG
jgi:hypothetical protein